MDETPTVRLEVDLPLTPDAAFVQCVDELSESFARAGLRFTTGEGGRVSESGREVAQVAAWEPGRTFELVWNPTPWKAETPVRVALHFHPRGPGTRCTLEISGASRLVGDDAAEWTGWVMTAVAAPALRALDPRAFGDWLTDRRARRPSGPWSRTAYADPLFHKPNFRLILETLQPGPSDRVLEVGCGGGALLREVLARGATAVGVDHSPEMVRLARAVNEVAVREGRLEVVGADAGALPVADRSFSMAISTGVFGFLPDPGATLREIYRALRPGGRLAVFTVTRALSGTPAAPPPMAMRLRFFEDDELAALARDAGFVDVAIAHPDLERHAREAGLDGEALELFRQSGGSQFLTARRAEAR